MIPSLRYNTVHPRLTYRFPLRWRQKLIWRYNNNDSNTAWYQVGASGASYMVIRANVPYDPWKPVDGTTDSARWYNTIRALYKQEYTRSCGITVKARALFPVSGNRYSNYWRMFLIPCNYDTMAAIAAVAPTMNKLMSLPGVFYKDIMPLGTNRSYATLSGYLKPLAMFGVKQRVGEVTMWFDTGANPSTAFTVYWMIYIVPLKLNTAAADVASAADSLYIDVKSTFYTDFKTARTIMGQVTDDDIVGADTDGAGEAPIVVAGVVTAVPGAQGQS